MFGLAIIFFLLLYLVIWILVVLLAAYFGWRFTKSKKVMFTVGAIAFLAMYWPAFGDLIPTLWAHKNLCKKEAGFKIYVTPEQWDKENPGVLDTLHPYENYIDVNDGRLKNSRFKTSFKIDRYFGYPIKKYSEKVYEIETNRLLAESTDFSRGYGNLSLGQDNRAIKIWLSSDSCFNKIDKEKNILNIKEYYSKLKMKWGF